MIKGLSYSPATAVAVPGRIAAGLAVGWTSLTAAGPACVGVVGSDVFIFCVAAAAAAKAAIPDIGPVLLTGAKNIITFLY